MSFKVPKFNFEEFQPAKLAKVANPALVEGNTLATLATCEFPRPQGEERKESVTCFECGHFHPAINSPNPAHAWGRCDKRNRGRYGVAMACEAMMELYPALGQVNH